MKAPVANPCAWSTRLQSPRNQRNQAAEPLEVKASLRVESGRFIFFGGCFNYSSSRFPTFQNLAGERQSGQHAPASGEAIAAAVERVVREHSRQPITS